MAFDITASFRPQLPAPEGRWGGMKPFSFVGGHNDGASVPFAGLAEAATTVLAREGANLATYNLGGSPQGYAPLRTFIADTLAARASMPTNADEVLVTSGSLQALDLVNQVMLEPGDTVIVEQATYGGTLSRLAALGVNVVGVDLDDHGIDMGHLSDLLGQLSAQGRLPKFIYTIPTVQNPTGSVLPIERRLQLLELAREHEVAIFEDDCYADLTWDGQRPPTIRALDEGGGQVVYCGSFSKSLAPALRVGYLVADWPALSQMLAVKTDAGSGALEQLVVAEYAASHFDDHVRTLTTALEQKCDAMCDAVRSAFGDSVSFVRPRGGIFVWLTFGEDVDTSALVAPAAEEGIEFNPGVGWSVDPAYGSRRLRLCFGHPSTDVIEEGVSKLAEVFRAQGAI